ncbi:MAG: GNAT family N-acetyltransferase [Lachnospiraceae bacterium]|nr:GNAT family N-acetyltransferase [Lachnospiraceae bacterium]
MINVRELRKDEWTQAMALAWRTFLRFEANDCEPEGVSSFYRFVTDDDLEKMFLIGEYKAFGAFDGDRIVGISGVRSTNFLSILFVDEAYHRRGIATALVEAAAEYICDEKKKNEMTVYAAMNAVGFYLRLGFSATGEKRSEAGITFLPMCLRIR